MSKIGTQKYNNCEYAPGIATYGIDGRTGIDGTNGTSVFVSIHNINDSVGAANFGEAVLQRENMTDQSKKKINRDYIDGDCFIFQDGGIWRIDDVKSLKNAVSTNQFNVNSVSDYMTKVGNIESTADDGFSENGDYLILDTVNYKGFMIDTTGSADSVIDDKYVSPFTILSNDVENDNRTYFISLKSVFAGESIKNLKIYYDNDNSAWVIDSDVPVLFNCDVKTTDYSDSVDYDEYSKPLFKEDNITSFYSMCKNISYSVKTQAATEMSKPVRSLAERLVNTYKVEYTPYIDVDRNYKIIYDNGETWYPLRFTMYNGNQPFTNDSQFDAHKMAVDVKYDGVVVKHYDNILDGNNIAARAIYGPNNVRKNDNLMAYRWTADGNYCIELDADKIFSNFTRDDKFSIDVVWSYKVFEQYVDFPLTVKFKIYESYENIITFDFNHDNTYELKDLAGCLLHISSYRRYDDNTHNRGECTGEYFVPVPVNESDANSRMLTDNQFTLMTDVIVDKDIEWSVSAIRGVEVTLNQINND